MTVEIAIQLNHSPAMCKQNRQMTFMATVHCMAVYVILRVRQDFIVTTVRDSVQTSFCAWRPDKNTSFGNSTWYRDHKSLAVAIFRSMTLRHTGKSSMSR